MRSRTLREHQFVQDKGACLLNKSGRQTFYSGYETFVPSLRRYLRRQTYRLARELNQLSPAEKIPL